MAYLHYMVVSKAAVSILIPRLTATLTATVRGRDCS